MLEFFNSSHCLQAREESIPRQTACISSQELRCMSRNIFAVCKVCLESGGQAS